MIDGIGIDKKELRRLRKTLDSQSEIGYMTRSRSLFAENHMKKYLSKIPIEPRCGIITYYGSVDNYQIVNDRNFVSVNFVI